MTSSTSFPDADAGRPADTACLGRCHAPIRSRRTSRPATSDTTKGSQATPADSLKESQLAARSGPSPRRRTSPTPANRNSKPLCGGAATHVSAPRRATPGRPLRQWRADALALLPSRLRIPRFRPAGASGRWTRWAALGGVLAGTGTSRVACARSARAGRERPQRGDGPVAAPEATTLDGCGSNRSSTRTASAPSQSAQSTRACSTASRPPCRRVRGAQPT
jgi:hypothetical protein